MATIFERRSFHTSDRILKNDLREAEAILAEAQAKVKEANKRVEQVRSKIEGIQDHLRV